MSAQSFYVPTRIVHGADAIGQLSAELTALGIKRPLIVSDPVIAATPFYKVALDGLREAGIDFDVFEDCAVDARLRHVTAQAERVRSEGFDGVIGIGGGSAMCTAKPIAAMATNPGSYADYLGVEKFKTKPLPNIMVPTTAGSGSEVSGVALVLDEDANKKLTVRDSRQYPNVAILDPMALHSCPPKLAVYSAVDALTHAVEGFLSPNGTGITDAYGIRATEMLVNCTKASAFNKDIQAMADNLLASSMANISFGSTGVGMAHILAYPIEEKYHIPHGRTVATLLPRLLEHSDQLETIKLDALLRAFGAAESTESNDQKARTIVEKLENFYRSIEFPLHFGSDEVDFTDQEEMTGRAHAVSSYMRKDGTVRDQGSEIVASNGFRVSTKNALQIYQGSVAA